MFTRPEIAAVMNGYVRVELYTDASDAVSEENQKVEEDPSQRANKGDELLGSLPSPASLGGHKLQPVEFEKDDDTNFHIAFITACSNLRARNYKIPEADFNKTKQIAGKIIPAMVTTTALVTGLVCMEWYKLIQDAFDNSVPVDAYKNAFVNVALPFVTLSEPLGPKQGSYGDVKFTLWDRFDVDFGRDVTLQEFIDFFMKQHQLEISMISCGATIVYSFFTAKSKLKERLATPISKVVQEVSKQELPAAQRYIILEICVTYKDEDVETPGVRYKFRH